MLELSKEDKVYLEEVVDDESYNKAVRNKARTLLFLEKSDNIYRAAKAGGLKYSTAQYTLKLAEEKGVKWAIGIGRYESDITLEVRDKVALREIANSNNYNQHCKCCAKALLRKSAGDKVTDIGKDLKVQPSTVYTWCRAYKNGGLAALGIDRNAVISGEEQVFKDNGEQLIQENLSEEEKAYLQSIIDDDMIKESIRKRAKAFLLIASGENLSQASRAVNTNYTILKNCVEAYGTVDIKTAVYGESSKSDISLPEEDKEFLTKVVESKCADPDSVVKAKVLLCRNGGNSIAKSAEMAGAAKSTATTWCCMYNRGGLEALHLRTEPIAEEELTTETIKESTVTEAVEEPVTDVEVVESTDLLNLIDGNMYRALTHLLGSPSLEFYVTMLWAAKEDSYSSDDLYERMSKCSSAPSHFCKVEVSNLLTRAFACGVDVKTEDMWFLKVKRLNPIVRALVAVLCKFGFVDKKKLDVLQRYSDGDTLVDAKYNHPWLIQEAVDLLYTFYKRGVRSLFDNNVITCPTILHSPELGI